MARRPLTVPTSGTVANALDYGDTPTPLAVWVTPDGVVVGGPGAWQQLSSLVPQAYAANWAVPDWYLDGVVGLDTNNGTTALTPLRTGAELLRRLGPYALWGQSVTVHVLANGMTDALILRGAMLVAGTHLDVIGTPTQLADAGTVATYTGIVHATPAAPQVSTTLIADWTAHQWKRLRITAGAAGTVGAVSFVAKANPAGVGLNIARTQRWSRIKQTTTPTWQVVNPVVGDSVVVESLPSIPSLTLLVDGPLTLAKSPAYAARQWSISSIACQQISVSGPAVGAWGLCTVFGSVILTVQEMGKKWGTGSLTLLGCLIDSADTSGSTVGLVNTSNNYNACLFGNRTIGAFCYSNQATSFNSCLFQNVYLQVSSYAWADAFESQIFDVTNAATPPIRLLAASVFRSFGFSGSGNASYGTQVNQSVSFSLSAASTWNLTGALGDFRIADAPAYTLTLAQFRQPDDYAQKGTSAAMVAGTITITVPWYDNAVQKVTATHAAFAGTPGILSVQQISTTQFTITSSNALDTSTVNWQISPLGRNIFISTI